MGACDLCRGSQFEVYLESTSCGRELVRCKECGLVSARAGSGGRVPEQSAARDPRTDLKRAAAVMRLLSSGKVLEIGCGTGDFLSSLNPARYEVVGVETAASRAAEAQRKLAKASLRGAIVPAPLAEAGLPAETFDLVAMFCTLERTPSPRATLMEASRLLRAGGLAVLETPSLSSLTARLCGSRWHPLSDPGAEHFFTSSSLHRLASTCGLAGGAARMSIPLGWPSPGTLVLVARKSAVSLKVAGLAELASPVGKISPMGATQ